MAKKTRRHTLTITVVFDRACTKAVALRETRNAIHSDFYTTQLADDEPEQFRVAGFGKVKANG